MRINWDVLTCVAFLVSSPCLACLNLVPEGWKQVGLEERARRSSIVFHGLAIEAIPVTDNLFSYSVQFWLINVYKGAESVGKLLDLDPGSGGVFNLRDRKINVTGFSYKSKCHNAVAPQKYYIIFCELRGNELVAKFDDLFGASAEWSEKNERRVWHGVGWENWSDWGPCSASCGEGSQERWRKCLLKEKNCHGYNKERRRCNMFSCQGSVDPMRLDDRRFFHPSRGEWQRVSGRPTAWKLRPNSYVWVPSSQIFPNKSAGHKPGIFPREFSLLVTLKLSPKKPMQGILFSLRSRREQSAYLSLELEAPDRIRVVHASKNGTQAVIIPMKLNDGHWHQLGIALQDDNSVRSFLDCAWVSTDILKRNELDHPEDADLIIGYLFQGELEQLMIIPNPGAVAQQCSSTRIPIFDSTISNAESPPQTPTATASTVSTAEEDSKIKRKFNDSSHHQLLEYEREVLRGNNNNNNQPQTKFVSPDEDSAEGSGNENESTPNRTNYELEWSEWSPCSATCGPGLQTRYSRCIDDGSQLELCLEAGSERTETRSCMLNSCQALSSGLKSDFVSTRSELEFSPTPSPPAKNSSDPETPYEKHVTDEIFFPSDMFFYENHTSVAKHHNGHHGRTHNNRRVTTNKSWNILKKRLLRENGSKKIWCSCLNGGTCNRNENKCHCPDGYSGRFCESFRCKMECLNGGSCVGSNICTCPPGFQGPECGTPKCDPPCENGGTCIRPDTCLCPAQTTGSHCQKYFCRSPCLNGGSCVGPDQCECPHNATGRNCESAVCEPPCENGATCSPGNWCVCSPSSYGIRCERRKCEYVPVKEPFTRGFKRLIGKKVEGKCESLTWKTCTRTVPEYQTVYKTFYRTVYKCKEDLIGDKQQRE